MEVWKDVKGYGGRYKISSFGNVKSMERIVKNKNGYRVIKNLIMKKYISTNGYHIVMLSKNSKTKTHSIHSLIAASFMNHIPNGFEIVIDHIDNNKLNNHIDNLQLITNRENSIKDRNCKGESSKYVGVYFHKRTKKYMSRIFINGKRIYLGVFSSELLASKEYQKALHNINK